MVVSEDLEMEIIREEVDIIDPRFVERQRNEYASRGVGYIVMLNGIAAIALLVGIAYGMTPSENLIGLSDAMIIFGAGTLAGLASALFAYLGRTFRLETLTGWRKPFRWLAIAAVIASAACFILGLHSARTAVVPDAPTVRATMPSAPEPVGP